MFVWSENTTTHSHTHTHTHTNTHMHPTHNPPIPMHVCTPQLHAHTHSFNSYLMEKVYEHYKDQVANVWRKNGCWLWEMKETNTLCELKADLLNVTVTNCLKSLGDKEKNFIESEGSKQYLRTKWTLQVMKQLHMDNITPKGIQTKHRCTLTKKCIWYFICNVLFIASKHEVVTV